jgi:hypothetical protein
MKLNKWSTLTVFILFSITLVVGVDQPQTYYANWSNSGVLADPDFFPIAVWLQVPSFARQYKATGVNLYIGLPTNSLTEVVTLKSYGMNAICQQTPDLLSRLSLFQETIVGWMHDDEPDIAQLQPNGSWGPCVEPSVVIADYQTWKTTDPTRPIYVNFGPGVTDIGWIGRSTCTGQWWMYQEYQKGADMLGFDYYPVNDSRPNDLWMVPKGVDSLQSWSNYQKPVMAWIECTDIGDGAGGKPTVAQVKTEVWMSIIHGADGYGYFCHAGFPSNVNPQAVLSDGPMVAGITEVNNQVTSLARVLNTPDVKGRVSVSSSNGAVPIDILVKEYQGGLYIFAVTMRPGAVSGTFTVNSPPPGTATVLGESRSLTVSGGTFTDTFGSYAYHLYQIGGTPVNIPAVTPTYPEMDLKVTCSPNPFKNITHILAGRNWATGVSIYTADGRLVRSLQAGQVNGLVTWDGRDGSGRRLSPGVYLVQVSGNGQMASEQVLLTD